MQFASDNTGPVHPKVLEALAQANEGYAPAYGEDDWTARAISRIRTLFDAPDATVFLVPLGTAANTLLLSTLVKPWQQVFCHKLAHILTDECNAPELLTGGARLCGLDGAGAKIDPAALKTALDGIDTTDPHLTQPGPLSITQVTERGTVYALDEIRALTGIARAHGLAVHMDGARFANAVEALGCTPAEMTWKSGIDAVSFGGTKNGLMGVEAMVIFDPGTAWELELRRKRAAQLLSKHRYLGAQMTAYLDGGLWRDLAAASNRAARRLADGLGALAGITIDPEPAANMIFAEFPGETHDRLASAGLHHTPGNAPCRPIRLVCDWSTQSDAIDRYIRVAAG